MELNLDFSGLDSIALKQAQKDFTEPAAGAAGEPAQRASEAPESPQSDLATIKLQRDKEDHQKNLEVYREYQDNIRRSGQLRSELLKGVKAGEAPQSLLLKAVECISCMTGDTLFYNQMKSDLKAIYGEGFLDEIPLEWELEEVRKRTEKLQEALHREGTDTASREQIQRAIEAHRRKERELEELIKHTKAEETMEAGA